MNCLIYPFDGEYILQKKKFIKRELLASGKPMIDKKVAILGGSTTAEIRNILELFLLSYGIRPIFYESEYAMYWQDAMFGKELEEFGADIVYIHTTSRNISVYPSLQDSKEKVDKLLDSQMNHFVQIWDKLLQRGCAIIQNNFERPAYRLLGNKDVSDYHGRSNYISCLNQRFYTYAQASSSKGFYINDIDYLSASYGLEKWADISTWHMYKYALNMLAIPELAFNVANIVKSIYGGNKKAIVLDLDNTLWGGTVGDDGTDGIVLGQDSPAGQAYSEFQDYVKAHMDLGVLLAVCSKNDEENAIAGLRHPDSRLTPDDFSVIKANWENKDRNILAIAQELNVSADSFVFVDDNPAERAIVTGQIPGIAAPDIGEVDDYVRCIDRSGFFEVTAVTQDDLTRGQMYRENAMRSQAERSFDNYEDYLTSLQMKAVIRDFESIYLQRIAQLTNKTNQFNLTTKRYSEGDIAAIAADGNYIRLYGRLEDRFGDSGIVSVIIGHKDDDSLHIDLWLMSCRVLKRNMEYAMFDRLVEKCRMAAINKIIGYYYQSAKNSMVRDFYRDLGFERIEEKSGGTVWEYRVATHKEGNQVIMVM